LKSERPIEDSQREKHVVPSVEWAAPLGLLQVIGFSPVRTIFQVFHPISQPQGFDFSPVTKKCPEKFSGAENKNAKRPKRPDLLRNQEAMNSKVLEYFTWKMQKMGWIETEKGRLMELDQRYPTCYRSGHDIECSASCTGGRRRYRRRRRGLSKLNEISTKNPRPAAVVGFFMNTRGWPAITQAKT